MSLLDFNSNKCQEDAIIHKWRKIHKSEIEISISKDIINFHFPAYTVQ